MRLLVLLLLLLPIAPVNAQSSDFPAIEMGACPFLVPDGEVEGTTLHCGHMTTLENPYDPHSHLVELAFAILDARHDSDNSPLVYLEGGPGGSALVGLDSWVNSPLRKDRDIVLVDQRGTGFSMPSLDCGDIPDHSCRLRLLEVGVDLGQYHTINNAIDIADLIRLLGYPQVDVLGVSYGTRLALVLMRDHPTVVRSVVLDSVYPPVVDAYEQQPRIAQHALDRLFAACQADETCHAAYPDLETVFYRLVEEFNREPERAYSERFTGDDWFEYVYEGLIATVTIPAVPAAIYAAHYGDLGAALDLLMWGPPGVEEEWLDLYASYPEAEVNTFYDLLDDLSDAEGAFNSFECYEEIPFNDLDEAYDLAIDVHPAIAEVLLAGVEDMFDLCEMWGVGAAPLSETMPVSSNIPTLVLAGQFDPLTPSEWGRIAASSLTHSFFYEFPGVGHGVIDAGTCPENIITQFWADPLNAPDAACIEEMGISFYVQ